VKRGGQQGTETAMKRVMKGLCISVALILPAVAMAQGKDAKPAAVAAVSQVSLVGTNYCSGCALKKQNGAAAQCSKYGHRHSLKVEKAVDASGKELPDMAGRTLAYLENDKSEKLFRGEAFHGERVEVKGRLYAPEGIVEVQEYKAP
jgi:hypothetical protein